MWLKMQKKRVSRWRCCWSFCKRSDSGAVTAEFAVILPAVVAVAALLLGLTQAVSVSLNCQDAARVAAREIVVHQGEGDPAGIVQQIAGPHAQLSMKRSDSSISVLVTCPITAGPFGVLPAHVSGSAVSVLNE